METTMEKNNEEKEVKESAKVAPGTTFGLLKNERLQLENLHLKRQVVETQAMQQLAKIERDQQEIVSEINARIKDDMRTYRIDLDKGEMTKMTDDEIQKMQMAMSMQQLQNGRGSEAN